MVEVEVKVEVESGSYLITREQAPWGRSAPAVAAMTHKPSSFQFAIFIQHSTFDMELFHSYVAMRGAALASIVTGQLMLI